MSRVKTGSERRFRHKKVLGLAKGYRMSKHRLYKVAHEAVLHAGEYAFFGRKRRKRDFRRLWQIRIKAGLLSQANPLSYSRFINSLKVKNVTLDRKILSQLASTKPDIFTKVFQFINS